MNYKPFSLDELNKMDPQLKGRILATLKTEQQFVYDYLLTAQYDAGWKDAEDYHIQGYWQKDWRPAK
jgi:hypothetical protein